MVDIHCHILPEIDDGAKSLYEAVELCRMAEINHITDIILTPHFQEFTDPGDFFALRDEKYEELKEEIEAEGILCRLYSGAEVAASEEMFGFSEWVRLTLAGSRYLLLELPFVHFSPDEMGQYVECIKEQGLIPVIAHAERYSSFHRSPSMINELLGMDALLQVNLASLTGAFGGNAMHMAHDLIRSEVVSFLSTDAHSLSCRNNNVLAALPTLEQEIPRYYLEQMLIDNPQMILENQVLEL